MRLAYAFLAHAAEFTQDGRLWVLGGDIDTLRFREFPAAQPALTLVFKVQLEPYECGRHYALRLDVIDPTGEVMNPQELVFEFDAQLRPDQPDRPVAAAATLHFQNLPFPNPGDYAFRVSLDGEELGATPLRVMPQP